MNAVLTHTPLWVWGVLALLVQRGVAAARPDSVTPQRLFLLPLVFTGFGMMGLARTGALLPVALAAAAAGLLAGALAGRALYAGQCGYLWDGASGELRRPGSWMMLVCSMVAFVLKFALGVLGGRHPELMASTAGAMLNGLVSGATAGLLWGASATQLLLGRARPAPTAMGA